VLWTSLGLAVLVFFRRGKERWWWLTAAVCWWFVIVLLCTVGRPLSRYLLPVIPIMLWTLGAVLALAWSWLATLLERSLRRALPPPGAD